MNPIAKLFSGSSLTRGALEISPSAVVVADRSGIILFANEQVRNWFGYALSEIAGSSLEGLLPAIRRRDQDAHRAPRMSHSMIPTVSDGPQRVICKDGSELEVRVTFTTVEEESQSLLLANFDRTEQQIRDGQFLESQRLEAISTMISGLAHESRNALQRAVACLDLMELDLQENQGQLELSRKIRQSLSDLLENYDEVRRFALPITLTRETRRVIPVCQEAYREVARQSGAKTSEFLIADRSQTDDWASFDPGKMKEVFRHIIENAFEQPPDEVKILVECKPATLRDQDALQILIFNDGHAFGEVALKRAFDAFYTTKQHGTGLGLSICRRIVSAHGGTIQVLDPSGGGALVDIVLPKLAHSTANRSPRH